MKRVLKTFDDILIRFLAFSLAFFTALPCIPKIQNQNSRVLNVKIYKRSANEDCTRPNPLILLVQIDTNNRLTLNNEEFNLIDLEAKLTEVFKDREIMSVNIDGETEIYKTVFIKPHPSVEYENLVKIIDSLKKIGASRIFIDPFNENCQPITYGCGSRRESKHPPHNLKKKSKQTKD